MVPLYAADASAKKLISSKPFKAAATFLERDYDRFVSELITLTEIPAPPFKEQARAAAYLEMLRGLGLTEVEQDAEGNVMGVRKGRVGGATLAVVAHLDTVFPEGTDVRVRREGTRLKAPGVGDDTRSLALLLWLVRAMNAAGLQTDADILFVGNVGEEGEGDLRGVKYLLQQGKYKGRIQRFLAVEPGDPSQITNGALGSKRYRVSFKGPGGHSYNDFGAVSPAFALGNAISKFARIPVPKSPKTTFNVGTVTGGTSVNSIPLEMSMDVDMRSESPAELERLVAAFMATVQAAVAEENQTRSTAAGKITADLKLIGDRPAGETATDSPFVRNLAATISAFGVKPSYATYSTDSNVPISMGIPAVTIRSGHSDRAHSLDEWADVEKGATVRAAEMALALLLGAADIP